MHVRTGAKNVRGRNHFTKKHNKLGLSCAKLRLIQLILSSFQAKKYFFGWVGVEQVENKAKLSPIGIELTSWSL